MTQISLTLNVIKREAEGMQKEYTSNANVVESVHNDSRSQGLSRNQSVWQNGHSVNCCKLPLVRDDAAEDTKGTMAAKHSLTVAHVDSKYVCCQR